MKLSPAFEASIALSFGDVSDAYQFFPSTLGISDNPDYRANLQHCRITDIDYKRNHAGVSDHVPFLVATMLDVRSANLMDLAAGLPREADRTDMRYQWITRLLGNPLVVSDKIMEPFAREVLERAAVGGQPLVLILDQSKVSDRHQVLMLALRCGERALPLAWRVEETDGQRVAWRRKRRRSPHSPLMIRRRGRSPGIQGRAFC